MFRTNRLTLRPFEDTDLDDFSALHADPQAMRDLGGPISRADAQDKLIRYLNARDTRGISRMHVSDEAGFVGYVGLMPRGQDYPMGHHVEIGWRLLASAWGKGYATEAARAILTHAFATTDLAEILSYTAPANHASQAVMSRLGLTRDATRDFRIPDPVLGEWHGLVWTARAADWPITPA